MMGILTITGWWFTYNPRNNDGVRQLGWWNSQLNGKIKFMFQTTKQEQYMGVSYNGYQTPSHEWPWVFCLSARNSSSLPLEKKRPGPQLGAPWKTCRKHLTQNEVPSQIHRWISGENHMLLAELPSSIHFSSMLVKSWRCWRFKSQFLQFKSNQFLGKRGVTSADPQLGRKFPFCRQTSNEFLPDLIKTRFSYDVVAFKTREKNSKMKAWSR